VLVLVGNHPTVARFGYTMLCEQSGPQQLVDDVVMAEGCGFDFAVISDHMFPWLDEMGHSPYAWAVLGAAAHATSHMELMTYVTCPLKRYHPAVVAQKAATLGLLAEGRFSLGLGAGENLNEHVTGSGWPPVNVRHEMLVEAIEIIRRLLDGGYVSFRGRHFEVDSAKIWDLPPTRLAIGVAASGPQSCAIAKTLADAMIAVTPDAALVQEFRRDAGGQKPVIGQIPVCFDRDRGRAIERAHRLFRWFGGGWKVNAELPGTAAFAAASQHVQPDDVAAAIPCGDDTDEFAKAIMQYEDAGFTDIALVQIGGDAQKPFLRWCETVLLPALRGQ
jgi:G6PDH family F420-dependent oxidoreductase